MKAQDASIVQTSYYNNPFIGLYCRASDSLAIVAGNCHQKLFDAAEKALGVPVEKAFISESHLVGTYTAMNSHGVVLPATASEKDLHVFKKHGLNTCRLDKNAPGNVVLCNDHACLVSPRLTQNEMKLISDTLGVEAHVQRLSGLASAATTSVATNRGLLAYNELTDTEIKHLSKIFGVHADVGTTNFGVPFNALGLVANSHGALVGQATTGHEMQRIYETLFG